MDNYGGYTGQLDWKYFSNLQTLSIELKWGYLGVSYNKESAGKCGHLQRDGGSINRLQVYIGDTNVN